MGKAGEQRSSTVTTVLPETQGPPAAAAEASTSADTDEQRTTAVAEQARGFQSVDEAGSSGADDGASSSGPASFRDDALYTSSEGDSSPTAVAARSLAPRAPTAPTNGEIPQLQGDLFAAELSF